MVFLMILAALFVVLFVLLPSLEPLFLPPTGSFTGAQKATDTTENVFFGKFNKDVKPSEIRIVIENQTASPNNPSLLAAVYHMSSTDLSGPLTYEDSTMNDISGVTYTDKAQDKKISSEDYITIRFTYIGSGSRYYMVGMIHIPTGEVVDEITFTW
jgi:hypothetical protein